MKRGLMRQLGNIHVTMSKGRKLVGMIGVSIYIPFLGKIDSYTYLIKAYMNTNKPSLVSRGRKLVGMIGVCYKPA